MDWGIGWSVLFPPPLSDEPIPGVRRCFRPRTYIFASLADIALRLVWVLSLLPISALLDDPVNRVAFRACVSALELLRRSMWFVLRVEHEQAANGGHFRKFMWVPKAHGAPGSGTRLSGSSSYAADTVFRRRPSQPKEDPATLK